MTEQVRRRRRRRRGRRGGARGEADAAAQEPQDQRAPSVLSQWQWATFPVFAAFALGIVVMGFVASTGLALVVFFAGVFGVALSAAHIVTRQIVANRRRR